MLDMIPVDGMNFPACVYVCVCATFYRVAISISRVSFLSFFFLSKNTGAGIQKISAILSVEEDRGMEMRVRPRRAYTRL